MKEDLKEIENKIMEFCKKYNCSIETHRKYTYIKSMCKNNNIGV